MHRTRYRTWSCGGSSVPHDPHNSPVAVSPPPPSPLGSTSVSFHRWSAMSVISPCGIRYEVLRPSVCRLFSDKVGLSASCGLTARTPTSPRRQDRSRRTSTVHSVLSLRRSRRRRTSRRVAARQASGGSHTGLHATARFRRTRTAIGPLTGSSPGINPLFSSAPSRGCERTAAASGSRQSRRR